MLKHKKFKLHACRFWHDLFWPTLKHDTPLIKSFKLKTISKLKHSTQVHRIRPTCPFNPSQYLSSHLFDYLRIPTIIEPNVNTCSILKETPYVQYH